MECNNYEFCVGDEVETVDGMVGKIVSICHCERCAERGFFEPKWETSDGEYSDYITVNQANRGFLIIGELGNMYGITIQMKGNQLKIFLQRRTRK